MLITGGAGGGNGDGRSVVGDYASLVAVGDREKMCTRNAAAPPDPRASERATGSRSKSTGSLLFLLCYP